MHHDIMDGHFDHASFLLQVQDGELASANLLPQDLPQARAGSV
jgi:hypothetical protein